MRKTMAMRIVKTVLAVIVLIMSLVAIVAMFLPRSPVVSRSVDIAAPPAAVYAIVSDLRRFNEWSPWSELDPGMEITFTGPVDGVGQTMHWQSSVPAAGSGSQTITRLEPGREVETEIDFGDRGTAGATMRIEPAGQGTRAVWGFTTDLGFNPVSRYFGLMFDRWIGPDYEKGLARLKALAEAPPPSS